LAMKQTLCQDLYCAESLARADVLCLDKTGTITEGKMKVEETVRLDESFDVEQALKAFSSAFNDKNLTLSAVAESYSGDSGLTLKGTVAFSSARKWSAAEFENYGTLVFGAPNFVLGEKYADVADLCEKYTDKGMRVLALAFSEKPCEGYNLPDDISAKALVVLSDKIRESSPAALKFFREQGVQLKVISGDDPKTVAGAAGRAGLEGAENYVDMSKLSDEEIPAAALKYTVFGRVLPEQKLALVKSLKASGKTVAMMGDGVNDVPALKEADCSIAIQAGSDAARSVSQLVLMNSEFSTLPLAVAEGRRCINNIERSAALFLVKTIFSFLLAAIFLVLQYPYPFKPIQLTLISSIMIGIPSFLLALEPNFNIVRGHFIANILKKAAPGGISVAVGISLLEAAGAIYSFSGEHISVMALFLTAAICFETLIYVCIPFDLKRGVMCGALAAIFVGAVLLFPNLFYITSLLSSEWIALGVIAGIALVLQPVLALCIKAFFNRKKRNKS
ncbi:MAG: HAD-IC family P-type ATPase, partial [Oscillospiraceae bacterium]